MFAALGRFGHRRRWWILAFWTVIVALGIALGGQLFDRLQTVDGLSGDAESVRAERQITDLVDNGPVVYAVVRDVDPYAPAVVTSVSAAAIEIRRLPHVVEVDDLYTHVGGRIGADNRSTLVRVELAENLSRADLDAAEDRVRARLAAITAPTVLVGGDDLAQRAFGDQAVRDLAVGESVALGLLIIALVVIFGGVVAASVPVAVAMSGISATLLALLGLSLLTTVGEFSVNIVTLLGLGLAVDFALLIVARYREELAAGADVPAAIETAVRRAGQAVAISGLAVASALTGLAVLAEPLLASMAVGGAVVVLLVTALALTLVPALVAIAGSRIPAAGARTWVVEAAERIRRLRPRRGGGHRRPPPLLQRLATLAQRRPAAVAVLTTLGLLALATPLARANFANSDARALPSSVEERQAYEAYQALFAAGEAAPVTVLANVNAATPQLRDYLNRLNRLPGVARLNLRRDVPTGWVIADLTAAGETGGEQSRDVVRAIRTERPAFPVLVSGEAAKVVDYQDAVRTRLPYAVGTVVLAMLVLLYGLTRSVVIPVKAVLLNALTFLATLGILIPIFAWGWGELVLRFDSWGALDLTTPLLLFVFIFGLSMDYEVFLLARITEAYRRRRDNDRAVREGITASGPVVTAAALCITIVFLGFAAGGLVALKEIGVGMTIAIVLDVTVVRGLLLPAVMTLLGELNWWTPTNGQNGDSVGL